MDISAPVTDYIRGSLLTTKGDLVKHNGVDAARLSLGSAGLILRVNAVTNDLEYQNPGGFLFDYEISTANALAVQLDAAWATIVSIDLGNVPLNSRYRVEGHIRVVKEDTDGFIGIFLGRESGTAEILFLHDLPSPNFNFPAPVGKVISVNFNFIMKVNVAGTLVLRIAGNTLDGTFAGVASNRAQLYIHKMK